MSDRRDAAALTWDWSFVSIHIQSNPSTGRRGVGWLRRSRTDPGPSAFDPGPCCSHLCSVWENRRSVPFRCTTDSLLCHSWRLAVDRSSLVLWSLTLLWWFGLCQTLPRVLFPNSPGESLCHLEMLQEVCSCQGGFPRSIVLCEQGWLLWHQ